MAWTFNSWGGPKKMTRPAATGREGRSHPAAEPVACVVPGCPVTDATHRAGLGKGPLCTEHYVAQIKEARNAERATSLA